MVFSLFVPSANTNPRPRRFRGGIPARRKLQIVRSTLRASRVPQSRPRRSIIFSANSCSSSIQLRADGRLQPALPRPRRSCAREALQEDRGQVRPGCASGVEVGGLWNPSSTREAADRSAAAGETSGGYTRRRQRRQNRIRLELQLCMSNRGSESLLLNKSTVGLFLNNESFSCGLF